MKQQRTIEDIISDTNRLRAEIPNASKERLNALSIEIENLINESIEILKLEKVRV